MLFFICPKITSAQIFNDSQILPPGHWIYDALTLLSMEQKTVFFDENSMMSAAEIKYYFSQLDYDILSQEGKNLYQKTKDFLFEHDSLIDLGPFRFDIDTDLALEFYYKSNPDIDWTFNYNYKNHLAVFPIKIGFSDYVTIESDPFLGKSHYGASNPYNFTNVPYKYGDIEYLCCRFAYGSAGAAFNGWGVNANIGKEGFRIGNSKTGSIIYNDTFETDAYFNLNLWTDYLKYSLDIIQICNTNWMYIHEFCIRPHKTFKLSVLEGSMLNAPFELRYLNPFMIMHQFASWTQYENPSMFYKENHFCAYLAGLFEWTPFPYFKLYGLYAQNELQLPTERDKEGSLIPDSLGAQLGVDIQIPSDAMHGWWNYWAEVIYASPYLYIKQNPESSLYRTRGDNLVLDTMNTWIGTPFGPDCFGVKTGTKFKAGTKWSIGVNYLFLAKGEHDFSIFSRKDEVNSDIYDYYPITYYKLHETSSDAELYYNKALQDSRNMWLTGIPEYTNQIEIEANYNFTSKLSLSNKFVYTYIINNKHKVLNANGIEIDLSLTYNLF